jgi:hypothetical protein
VAAGDASGCCDAIPDAIERSQDSMRREAQIRAIRAQTRGQGLVVFAQFRRHVEWIDVIGIVVFDSLDSRDTPDRAQSRSAGLVILRKSSTVFARISWGGLKGLRCGQRYDAHPRTH